jgi:hypothetical protein
MNNQPTMVARCPFRAYHGPETTSLPHWSHYTMCGVGPALLCYYGDYLCLRHFERYMICHTCGCAETAAAQLEWDNDMDVPLCPACLGAKDVYSVEEKP